MPVIAVRVFIWSFLSVKPQGVFKKTTGHFSSCVFSDKT